MDSSDSLKIDEHLARLLAAYDSGIDGGDGKAPTIGVSHPAPEPVRAPGEQTVRPLTAGNEGSVADLLPDSRQTPAVWSEQSATPSSALPQGPHRIGRFELRRQLGKGGCGIVFLAFDPKLEREVALKIPRPEMLLSQEARRRLVREALAAAEFDHPNLVPVYETGEIGPVCFIATAFCPGQTLGDWLDRQAYPIPVRQAARLVAIIAEAVQHAHDRGVLHRDLKPNNVILQATKDDPQEQEPPPGSCHLRGENYVPRVVDFGLAKLLERGGPSETNTRQVLGTPKYMAPEQAQARHEDIGPTADVYALGVILYELISGRAPYEGASDVEVLRQAIDGRLTHPRHIRADIPRDLEAICLKAMSRTPSRRYRTAIDLADDLRRFLDGKPTLARPLKWAGRAMRWLRRNDQVVALVVVTTVAAVLFAVGAWYMRQTRQLKDDQTRIALEQAERVRTDQNREYAQRVHQAFLAWQSGMAADSHKWLDAALQVATTSGDSTDFSLRYVASLTQDPRLCIVCPNGPVSALALSRDGNRLASGHADGTVAIWDRRTGRQLGSILAHEGEVAQLAFALGGSRLLTLGRSHMGTDAAICWTVTEKGALSPSPPTERTIREQASCLAVSADGSSIFTGSRDGEITRTDLTRKQPAKAIRLPGSDTITVLALSSDDKHLLVGTRSGNLRSLSIALEVEANPGEPVPGALSALAPGAKGSLVVGTRDGIHVVGQRDSFVPTAGRVRWIIPVAGGIAAPLDHGRLLLRLDRTHELATGDDGAIRVAAATRDGATLFTAGDDGIIRSWQLPGDLRTRALRSDIPVTAVGVDPAGTRITVLSPRSVTHDFAGTSERAYAGDATFVAIQVQKDGTAQCVQFAGQVAMVKVLVEGRVSGERCRVALPGDSRPTSAQFSADGARVAIGDDRGRVLVLSAHNGELITSIDCGHRRAIDRVALSEDGRLVAAPADQGIGIWIVENPAAVTKLETDDASLFRFVPSGDRIATAGASGAIRIWKVASGTEESVLHGHVGRVLSLGVSPDGRTLFSGGATGIVKFWDIRSAQEVLSLRRHSGPVTVLEMSANGKLLVSGGGGQIAVWEAKD